MTAADDSPRPVTEFETRRIEFWSDGFRLRGQLRLPVSGPERGSGLVFTPGWLGLAEGGATSPWLDALAAAGHVVLSFDYRGFGESEGPKGQVRADWQLEDIRNAVTYLSSIPEVDSDRMGVFGKGGTGGGNAYLAGAVDERLRCVVAMTPVADGAVWLRGMRREYEWRGFLQRIEAADRTRVADGDDPLVDPRTEIMIAAPERAAAPFKADADEKVGREFHLSTAGHVLRYRPLDMAHRLSGRPVLLIGIEEDVVTPFDHARSLFDALGRSPRRLVVLRHVAHYSADAQYFLPASRLAVEWASVFLRPHADVPVEASAIDDIVYPSPSPRPA